MKGEAGDARCEINKRCVWAEAGDRAERIAIAASVRPIVSVAGVRLIFDMYILVSGIATLLQPRADDVSP